MKVLDVSVWHLRSSTSKKAKVGEDKVNTPHKKGPFLSYNHFKKQRSPKSNNWSRPSDQQPASSGQARPSFNRSFKPSGRRNYINPGLKIDPNRFINRAQPQEAEQPYQPQHRFTDFPIDHQLKQNITAKGYTHPTAIQDQAIQPILQGHDVIGIANTGTGKTAAFLIPLLNKILLDRRQKLLVMVPTRELALQIQDELMAFARGLQIHSAFCIGGANIGTQIGNLRRNPNIVIGTPGRLKDLLDRKALYLGDFRTVVLDEADRMLDMGFIRDMELILSLLPQPRQTLLFSATFSPAIERLTTQFQRQPIKISVKARETSSMIDQDIVRFEDENHKIELLHDLLIKADSTKVLIFGETKHGVEKLTKTLDQRGFKAASIHGNKTQPARQKALRDFKQDIISILVATDVAARGLDIPHVSHVINYDVPASYEDYVHRIGRTGRAGRTGKALTFVR